MVCPRSTCDRSHTVACPRACNVSLRRWTPPLHRGCSTIQPSTQLVRSIQRSCHSGDLYRTLSGHPLWVGFGRATRRFYYEVPDRSAAWQPIVAKLPVKTHKLQTYLCSSRELGAKLDQMLGQADSCRTRSLLVVVSLLKHSKTTKP